MTAQDPFWYIFWAFAIGLGLPLFLLTKTLYTYYKVSKNISLSQVQ
jgi:hypothetical protein